MYIFDIFSSLHRALILLMHCDPITVSTPGNRKASSKAPSARSGASSAATASDSTARGLIQPGKRKAGRDASVASLASQDDFSSVAVTESKQKRKNRRRKPPGTPTLHNTRCTLLVTCDFLCHLTPCMDETVNHFVCSYHRNIVPPHAARHMSVSMH